MALEKFPKVADIAWGRIKEIRVSSMKGAYGFEFDLNGKKQKMAIVLSPSSTAYTLSAKDGTPIVHAIQHGKEVKVLDFSARPELRGPGGKIRKMGKIRKK